MSSQIKPEILVYQKAILIFNKGKVTEAYELFTLGKDLYSNPDYPDDYLIFFNERRKFQDRDGLSRKLLRENREFACFCQEIVKSIESFNNEKFEKLLKIIKILVSNREFAENTDLLHQSAVKWFHTDRWVKISQVSKVLAITDPGFRIPEISKVWYQIAMEAFIKKDLVNALEWTLKTLSVDPNHSQATILQGRISYENNDDENAIKLFNRVIKTQESADLHYYLHKVKKRQKGDSLGSRWNQYRATYLDPNTYSGEFEEDQLIDDCINYAKYAKNLETALMSLKMGEAFFPENVKILYEIGNLYFDFGDIKTAKRYYLAAIGLEPNNLELREMYTRCEKIFD